MDTASVVQVAAVLFAAVIMVGVGALPPAEVGIGPGSRMIPALLNTRTSENPPSTTLVNKPSVQCLELYKKPMLR
jgi:hypothetical protein